MINLDRGKLYMHANGAIYRYHGLAVPPAVGVVFHHPAHPMSATMNPDDAVNDPSQLVAEATPELVRKAANAAVRAAMKQRRPIPDLKYYKTILNELEGLART